MFCEVLNKRGYILIMCLQTKANAVHLCSECALSNINCVTAFLSLFWQIPRHYILSFQDFPHQILYFLVSHILAMYIDFIVLKIAVGV
jgi:hypothetical protein